MSYTQFRGQQGTVIEGEPESLNHKYEELSNHEALQVDLELKAAPAKWPLCWENYPCMISSV
jgi:hypothetical protein